MPDVTTLTALEAHVRAVHLGPEDRLVGCQDFSFVVDGQLVRTRLAVRYQPAAAADCGHLWAVCSMILTDHGSSVTSTCHESEVLAWASYDALCALVATLARLTGPPVNGEVRI